MVGKDDLGAGLTAIEREFDKLYVLIVYAPVIVKLVYGLNMQGQYTIRL